MCACVCVYVYVCVYTQLESKSVLLSEDTGLILPFTKVDKKQLISDKAKGRFPRVCVTHTHTHTHRHTRMPLPV